jgi:hypothetical protein
MCAWKSDKSDLGVKPDRPSAARPPAKCAAGCPQATHAGRLSTPASHWLCTQLRPARERQRAAAAMHSIPAPAEPSMAPPPPPDRPAPTHLHGVGVVHAPQDLDLPPEVAQRNVARALEDLGRHHCAVPAQRMHASILLARPASPSSHPGNHPKRPPLLPGSLPFRGFRSTLAELSSHPAGRPRLPFFCINSVHMRGPFKPRQALPDVNRTAHERAHTAAAAAAAPALLAAGHSPCPACPARPALTTWPCAPRQTRPPPAWSQC